MFQPFHLLLITLFLLLIVTLSSPFLDPEIVCGDVIDRHPSEVRCLPFLEQGRNLPQIYSRTTFGHNQPEPGTIPYHRYTPECNLRIETLTPSSVEEETFIIFTYYPLFYQVISQCLWPNGRHTIGRVPVGNKGIFFATLGAEPDPSIRANLTVEGVGKLLAATV